MNKLLKPKEVGQILGMSASHVYKLMERGELPYVRIPGRSPRYATRRIDPSDLERWIESHKNEPR